MISHTMRHLSTVASWSVHSHWLSQVLFQPDLELSENFLGPWALFCHILLVFWEFVCVISSTPFLLQTQISKGFWGTIMVMVCFDFLVLMHKRFPRKLQKTVQYFPTHSNRNRCDKTCHVAIH